MDCFVFSEVTSFWDSASTILSVDCSLPLENFLYCFLVFFQIDDMINELKFRDYVVTGKYVTEIDLGQFIRRKYCTNN